MKRELIPIYSVRLAMRLLLFFLLGRYEIEGRENLPADGAFVIVVNHNSVADSPLLLFALPNRRFRFFAGEKWARHPIYAPIMKWLGAIFIDRNGLDRRGLQTALDALEQGMVFALAPEGERSRTGHLNEAKDGVAYLVTRTGVPIVPAALTGTDTLFDNFLHLRRTTLRVRIGRPFTLPTTDRRVRQRDLPRYTHYIMVHLAALLPARYRGFYADSPALAALERGEDPWPHCA